MALTGANGGLVNSNVYWLKAHRVQSDYATTTLLQLLLVPCSEHVRYTVGYYSEQLQEFGTNAVILMGTHKAYIII